MPNMLRTTGYITPRGVENQPAAQLIENVVDDLWAPNSSYSAPPDPPSAYGATPPELRPHPASTLVDIPEEITYEVAQFAEEYHLFGSRSMAFLDSHKELTKDSDWDFAVKYTSLCEKIARDLGWVHKKQSDYADNLHVHTFEKTVGVHKVQISTKTNLSVFLDAYRDISGDFYWKYIHKSSPSVLPKTVQSDIFNEMYRMKGYK